MKKDRKKIIFEQAAILFQKKGYEASSTRELAEMAGIKVSSLYSHIGSKQELLTKICFDNANLFVTGIENIVSQKISNVEKLKLIIALHVDIALENPSSLTVFNDEWRHLSNKENEKYNLAAFLKLRKGYEQKFRRVIVAGIESNEIKNLNPDIILFTLITSIKWLHYRFMPKINLVNSELKKQIEIILFEGFVNRKY